jgi:Asp-tRNA(Asn)/Glu-tRNA(Gln) amidotransferase C subunit
MFSKIKSILASVKASFVNRMVEMSIEQETIGALKTAISDVETEFNIVKDKVESLVEPAVAKVEADVQAAAPVLSAAVKPLTDNVITGVKDLLALADRLHPEFDKIATLAKAAVGTGDIDAILTKLKAMLHYAGAKTDVWDEVVAVAKVL